MSEEYKGSHEDKYVDELIGIITESTKQVNEKGNEILEVSGKLIQNSQSISLTNRVPNPVKSKTGTKPTSGVTSLQEFLGVKESLTQKSTKEITQFLKDDKDTDLNTGIYPELKINDLFYDKLNNKIDKEKLDSYIYYFFYIITKYIVKPILDNKNKKKINGLNKFLKDNMAQLNTYINKPIEFKDDSIKGRYEKLKSSFTGIYTFMNDSLNNTDVTDKKMGEINNQHAALLKSINSFTFD
jgi:hypothetical protein